ncbi:hypothetical protein JNM05_10635 [bacterium]|nr:hypothetical protein [bacterium]
MSSLIALTCSTICIFSDSRVQGKASLGKTLYKLIGAEFSSVLDIGDESDNFPLDSIRRKKFLFIDEFEVQRLKPQTEKIIKILAGFGLIRHRKKYHQGQDLQVRSKLLIVSNNFPAMSDASNAIFRRIIPIRFDKVISPAKQIKWFSETQSFDKEMPGILNWTIEGIKELDQMDRIAFELPQSCQDWRDELRSEANQVMRWVEENCVLHGADRCGATFTSLANLFEDYGKWALEEGINRNYVLSKEGLRKKLMQSYHDKLTPKSTGIARGFDGIVLRSKCSF